MSRKMLMVLTSALAIASAVGAFAAPQSAPYRIAGVVLSTRDGAPVPYCRLTAAPANDARLRPPGAGTRSRPGPPGLQGLQPNRDGRLVGNDAGQGNRVTTKADSSGHFLLELPREGAWQVSAESRGFRSQFYDEHEGYFSSVVLTEAEPAHEVTFRLTPDAMISGQVMDEAGDPVARGQMVAELIPPALPGQASRVDGQRPQQAAVAQTDDRGRYELLDLAPGNYRVRVQAQPWYAGGTRGIVPRNTAAALGTSSDPSLDVVFPVTWFPAATSEGEGETITLAAGEDREADFHLAAIPAAHLIVARPEVNPSDPANGSSRPAQQMSVTRVSSEGMFGQTSFIGGNAREWDFGNLTPGTYEVRLPGPHGEQDGEVRQVEVRPGSSVLTLESATPLTRVKVSFEGAEGSPSVIFTDVETGRRVSSSQPMRMRGGRGGRGGDDADEDAPSRELIVMLPPHRYQVSVEGAGSAYVASISATGARATRTMVEIGNAATALTLHLASGHGEVYGVAKLAAKPDPGAMVLLVPATLGEPGDASEIRRDQSNTDGSFRLQAVVPGRYILVAVDHGWGSNWRTLDGLAKYLAGGVPVEVKSGDKLSEEIVALTP